LNGYGAIEEWSQTIVTYFPLITQQRNTSRYTVIFISYNIFSSLIKYYSIEGMHLRHFSLTETENATKKNNFINLN